MNPLLLTDGYKTGHHQQYPKGTTMVYSNFTPRSNKHAPKGCDKVVSFGQQMVMKQIHEAFHNEFFSKPKDVVISEIKEELSLYLGTDYDVSHFEKLHDLGYLPIAVRAIPEGDTVPIKVPVLTIYNTHPDFYWVTNYLETIISNLLWKPMTSATIAHQYRKVLTKWQDKTDKERAWFVDWQAHDFSMRGLDSIDVTISSGLGHATSFLGSDSLPVIHGARKYYGAKGMVVGSVNATEHSVMCAGSKDDEIGTFSRLLDTYPTGILSVVSDTWDLWKVCTEHVVVLKDKIMARDGKLVIRPDSGNPADIVCGYNTANVHDYPDYNVSHPSYKGVVELLWDVFGGTVNEQGYKVLDPHIGVIYGDSITLERAEEICQRLANKGFASTNIVFGVGSFTYQYNTRDTFGFAMKATYVEIDGVGREIFKNPITDDGTKKSATGLLRVEKNADGEYYLIDRIPASESDDSQNGLPGNMKDKYPEETDTNDGHLQLIYWNGIFQSVVTFDQIREKLK